MEVLTGSEMAARLDFAKPLHEAPEQKESLWCIPFEYGDNAKGTKISIALAKTIAAELRAHVAEAEGRYVLRAFKQEQARVEEYGKQLSVAREEKHQALGEIGILKQQIRMMKKAARKKAAR